MPVHNMFGQSSYVGQATLASDIVSGLSHIRSGDANILLLLLSFLSTSETVPLDLLFRGATPRKRWTAQGNIEDLGALHSSLSPELERILSDFSRTCNAIDELKRVSAVSDSNQVYSVNAEVATRVRASLSTELTIFWRYQALIVTYRAIPWKYCESM